MNPSICLLFVPILLLASGPTDALNILVVFPIASKSHHILGEGYVKALLKAGHQVTYVTPYPMKEKIPGRTEVSIEYVLKVVNFDDNPMMNLQELINTKSAKFAEPEFMAEFVYVMQKTILEGDSMVELINDKTKQFDVIITEWFFSNMLTSLSTVFQCPIILAPSTEVHDHVLELVDSLGSPATAMLLSKRQPLLPYKNMWERLDTLIYWYRSYRKRHEWQVEHEAEVYDKVIRPAAEARGVKNIPSYQEVIYNVSLVLYNSHPSLGIAQSNPPNVIPVGGYHVTRPTPPLPEDLQTLMDESTNGVIYFSMGSILKSEQFSDEWKTGLLNLFSKIKQTVLWKINGEFKDLPKNVHIRSWMPQQSILAHPNIKIFITHGGLLSTIESIHSGVPLIGVPIFGDQFVNMARAEAKGYAISVDARELIEELERAVHLILENERYANTAKLLSSYYHDRPRLPGDEIVYWVEHAYRTKGAPHLKPLTRNVPLYEKIYLDLLGVIFAVSIVFVIIICKLVSITKSFIKKKKD